MFRFVTELFKPAEPKLPPITSETSMNFDLDEVPPFLTRLANHPRFAFPKDFDQDLFADLQALAVDQTHRWQITCGFDGRTIALQIEAFMDDVASPDLSFFSTQEAVAQIERELEAFDEAT